MSRILATYFFLEKLHKNQILKPLQRKTLDSDPKILGFDFI